MRSVSKEDCRAYREVSYKKISRNEYGVGVAICGNIPNGWRERHRHPAIDRFDCS